VSLIRITNVNSVIRLTPEGETQSHLVIHNQESAIKISEVGMQGPEGDAGPPGRDGLDGQAGLPEVIDGGNF
jgi:hypothetical protein